MTNKLWLTSLLTALLLGSGCVIVGGNDQPGDVSFLWTLDGKTCAQTSGIAAIHIVIPGEVLEGEGYYDCTNGTADGIVLHDFAPGTYSYTVEALNLSNQVLYQKSGTFRVDGNVTVNVDLDPQSVPGDITFAWTFMGKTCSQASNVASVKVTIPGEALQNDGVYGCSNSGYEGITLHDFAPATYSYTVEGRNNLNQVVYTATGSVTVFGDVIVNVDLMPPGGGTSYATVSWTFPANWAAAAPSCAQATVDWIGVSIDGGAAEFYACADGFGGASVPTIAVAPGTHTIKLVAWYGSGATAYAVAEATGNITTAAYTPGTHYSFTLPWTIGGTTVAWTLNNGGTATSCGTAGVSTMRVDFEKTTTPGVYVYGGVGDPQPCTATSVAFNYLRPGTYNVYVWSDTGGYASPNSGNIQVTVTAGQFPPLSPPVITLVASN